MGTPHKHRDVIIAWANGERIECKMFNGKWELLNGYPCWLEDVEYRAQPKRVKKEGWVNVYPGEILFYFYSKEHADKSNAIEKTKRVACIRIEWEEEA